MELAVLFQMTFVGMPSIFYGDEKGLLGQCEPEYRRPMEFDADSPLEDVYRKLIAVRKEHESLCDGEYDIEQLGPPFLVQPIVLLSSNDSIVK